VDRSSDAPSARCSASGDPRSRHPVCGRERLHAVIVHAARSRHRGRVRVTGLTLRLRRPPVKPLGHVPHQGVADPRALAEALGKTVAGVVARVVQLREEATGHPVELSPERRRQRRSRRKHKRAGLRRRPWRPARKPPGAAPAAAVMGRSRGNTSHRPRSSNGTDRVSRWRSVFWTGQTP
jgi:hypothetical protein